MTKEQIINKAIKFHLDGNLTEAVKHYQYCINNNLYDHRVFCNLGLILINLGKNKEAEILMKAAIQLKPDFTNAHNNMGIIFRNLKKFKDAELSTRKAIKLNPDLAESHYNLGTILKDLGKLKEAELSSRKAIELKPDLAKAHYNLGTILMDLGKLKEVLILSKSTIKLKTISKSDKLMALVNITISNLLLQNFSDTLLNLNKINELINQGVANTIKDVKSRKHTLNFSKFIYELYSQLDKLNHKSESIIPHIGESHCLSFAHQIVSLSSKLEKIQPVLITGGKAWHFANCNYNHWKDSLIQQIKNHTYSNKILISFGEIDCRKDQGILAFSVGKNKKISEVCKNTIKGFINFMENQLSKKFSERYYFGIPAPLIETELHDELDKKRIEMIKIYNSILKKEVLSKGCYFLDVYELTSKKNGENNDIYMCDKIHLSPNCLNILFKNHLYKP